MSPAAYAALADLSWFVNHMMKVYAESINTTRRLYFQNFPRS